MKKIKENKRDYSTFKNIAITSLIWILLFAGLIAALQYSSYQYAKGQRDGFAQASEILNKPIPAK